LSSNSYRDKLLSIATPRKTGQPERRVRRERGATLIETEKWDGSQDATVIPDTIRHGARLHNSGKKRGEIAEIAPLSEKEKKSRYGDI
jgi:hypothetical protein